MSNITLQDLPTSLVKNCVWPWTEGSDPLPVHMQDGSPWPKISIVTPSYNQAPYLEETIRSVLLQGYHNLEYIIIDGGSTDGSVEIIKKYEPWLAHWESATDRGQGHAINKGFDLATGEIFAWINSDDYYAPKAFQHVAQLFTETDTLWVAGNSYRLLNNGKRRRGRGRPSESLIRWNYKNMYSQQGVFWRRELWINSGGIDEALECAFDYDLWLKFVKVQPFAYWTDTHLAIFRMQPESKSATQQLVFIQERDQINQRYRFAGETLTDRFQIWHQRRTWKGINLISTRAFADRPVWGIWQVLCTAPWLIFRKVFLKNAVGVLWLKLK